MAEQLLRGKMEVRVELPPELRASIAWGTWGFGFACGFSAMVVLCLLALLIRCEVRR